MWEVFSEDFLSNLSHFFIYVQAFLRIMLKVLSYNILRIQYSFGISLFYCDKDRIFPTMVQHSYLLYSTVHFCNIGAHIYSAAPQVIFLSVSVAVVRGGCRQPRSLPALVPAIVTRGDHSPMPYPADARCFPSYRVFFPKQSPPLFY